jgi:hypothetical protein
MFTKVLYEIYARDLNKLKDEIEQFADEAQLWETRGDIANSAGNLCLHLTGNLKHFIGAVIGDSGYIRDRDSEFASKGISKQMLLVDIDSTRDIVTSTLARLTDDKLEEAYPTEVYGHPMTTGYFLTSLTTHFNYHLGQINYLRRFLGQG